MADFSKNVTNSVNCFGPAPSTKWGTGTPYTSTWSVAKWGEGTEDLQVAFIKVIENSQDSTSAISSFGFEKLIENSQASTFEMSSEGLKSGDWSYVFPLPTTEAESRDASTYTSGTAVSQSWSSATASSTSWS